MDGKNLNEEKQSAEEIEDEINVVRMFIMMYYHQYIYI